MTIVFELSSIHMKYYHNREQRNKSKSKLIGIIKQKYSNLNLNSIALNSKALVGSSDTRPIQIERNFGILLQVQ